MNPRAGGLTGILALALALPVRGSQSPGVEAEALLQPAKAALEVQRDEEGRIALEAVLARFQEVTDWSLLMNVETASLVEREHLYTSGPLRAEPEAVMRVVEAVLASRRYALSLVRAEPPRVLSVRSLDTASPTFARQDATLVAAADLGRYAAHSATLLETVLSLKGFDVRPVASDLRESIADSNRLQVLSAGNGHELLLQGCGSSLASLSSLLRDVERQHLPEGERGEPLHAPPFLRRVDADVTLPAGSMHGLSLFDLVMTYAEKTGDLAVLTQESARLLREVALEFEAPSTIPAAEFPTLFEEVLFENEFAVVDLLEGDPGLFEVQSFDRMVRTGARSLYRFVDEASLQQCSLRPATKFMIAVHVPNTEVCDKSQRSSGQVVELNLLHIVQVGSTGSLLVRGFGRNLVALNEMLELVDAAAAAPDGGKE